MRLLLILLFILGLVTFSIGLVDGNGIRLRNSTQPHKGLLRHKPPANSVQIAGYYDPYETIDQDSGEKFTNKGGWFTCLLPMSDADAGKAERDTRTPPSVSADFKGTLEAELETWGWKEYPPHPGLCNWGSPSGGANIKHALDALGLNAFSKEDGGDNVCYTVQHLLRGAKNDKGERLKSYLQTYTVNGKQYRRTTGFFDFGINHVGGAIFARALLAPKQAALDDWGDFERNPTNDMMPDIRHASNIMAAYWLRGNPDPKSLKYYIALGIANDETLKVLATVVEFKDLGEIPVWPGASLDARRGEEGLGKMLLGSPIGATVGYILLNYKDAIGIKEVTEIVFFREDDAPEDPDDPDDDDWDEDDEESYPKIHMLFKIGDVTPPKDKEDEEMPDVPDDGDKGGKLMIKRTELGGGVVERVYTIGEGLRVHEFRIR